MVMLFAILWPWLGIMNAITTYHRMLCKNNCVCGWRRGNNGEQTGLAENEEEVRHLASSFDEPAGNSTQTILPWWYCSMVKIQQPHRCSIPAGADAQQSSSCNAAAVTLDLNFYQKQYWALESYVRIQSIAATG